jgi:hypothetical protein
MLALRGRGHFDDADVTDAVARALNGSSQRLKDAHRRVVSKLA